MTDESTNGHAEVESVVGRSLDGRADDLDGAGLDRVQAGKRRREQVLAVGMIVAVTALGAGILSLLTDGPTETIGGASPTAESEETTPGESMPIPTSATTVPVATAAPSDVSSEPTTTLVPAGAASATSPVTTPGEQTYTVVAGDSIARIAARHGIEMEVLAVHNEWADGISHLILPGDTILIPPGADVVISVDAAPATAVPGADLADVDEGCTYTIVAGDNPSNVASRFGITVDDLVGANSGSVMSEFLVGTQLVIPGVDDCG